MRTRSHAARVRAAAAALVTSALLLAVSGCSQSGSSHDDGPGSSDVPATASPAPTPTPTSTFRPGTASDPLRYAALGDSYSSGLGGGDASGSCMRSPKAFPHQLAKSKTIVLSRFVACSGATTTDVLERQIDALDPQIDLVTITIGGNDLGVSALPSACELGETTSCKAAVATSVALLHQLPDKLAKTYRAIAKAAPHARILVPDYPLFYDLPVINEDTLGSAEVSSAIAVDTAVASLDATIAKAVAKQRQAGTDIHFVDVSFSGHGLTAKKPWFVLKGFDAYHPTADGYTEYAKTLSALGH